MSAGAWGLRRRKKVMFSVSESVLLDIGAALKFATILVVLVTLARAAGRYGSARVVIERGGATTFLVCAFCLSASFLLALYARIT